MAAKIAPTDLKAGTLPATVLGNTATVGDSSTKLATTAFVNAYKVPISSLTAAVSTPYIDNVNVPVTWIWNSLSGTAFTLFSSSPVAAHNSYLFRANRMGLSSVGNMTTYAAQITNSQQGTNIINIALDLSAQLGTFNYALLVRPNSGLSGFGVNTPTSLVHLGAGSVIAGTAPLKFTTGTALATPEDGAVEYHGSHLYFTIGSTRYQLDQQSGGGGTWGSITGTLSAQTDLNSALAAKANVASPTFTGTPLITTTPTTGDNTHKIADTAYVKQELDNSTSYFGAMFGGTGTISDKIVLIAAYNPQVGTTYSLQDSDNGKVVTLSNASPITLTIPSGLMAGFNCSIVQLGAGQVTIAASGTTIHNRQSFTKTAGQYAAATILQYSTNTFLTQGDMA